MSCHINVFTLFENKNKSTPQPKDKKQKKNRKKTKKITGGKKQNKKIIHDAFNTLKA